MNIPILFATALVLATQNSNRIIIPEFEHKDEIRSTAETLPTSLRPRVKLVDSNSTILKRVSRFVEPMRNSIEGEEEASPESVFVRSSVSFLYQLSLGTKYGAGATTSWIDEMTHNLHRINFEKFKGAEGRYRLAQLTQLVLAYRPTITPHTGAKGNVADPGIRGIIEEMLDTAEYGEVVDRSGRLGLIRNPRIALRQLRHSLFRLVSRPSLRPIAKSVDSVSSLARVPLPVEAMVDLAKVFAEGEKFSPPMLDLSQSMQDIYNSTLAEYNPKCRPPKGALFQIHVHQPAICGNIWADDHTPRKKYDVNEHYMALANCHLTAMKSAFSFLKATN